MMTDHPFRPRNLPEYPHLPALEEPVVYGEGDPSTAKLVIVGEAPGAEEQLAVRPFVGRSGRLLERMLEIIGLARHEVYITNVVKMRPPRNRFPTKVEIKHSLPFLKAELDLAQTDIRVTLGKLATEIISNRRVELRDHGTVFKLGKHIVIPMYHPSYILRGGMAVSVYRKDWESVRAQLT